MSCVTRQTVKLTDNPAEPANGSHGMVAMPASGPIEPALLQLRKAHETARRLKRSVWDFAVEIASLKEEGIDHADLRSLICQKLIEHGQETSGPRAKRRTFRHPAALRLTAASCFVISDAGLVLTNHASNEVPPTSNGKGASPPRFSSLPVWDRARRELHLGNLVLKRYRQPAKNQEAILSAFEEEGWPERIDDPLTGPEGQDAQERLHNAVRKLNQQATWAIRFESDGSGEGVVWTFVELPTEST